MRFLHARVHYQRYRVLIAAALGGEELPAEHVLIFCPRCRAEFFADRAPGHGGSGREVAEPAAVARLMSECPDHAHRFDVG